MERDRERMGCVFLSPSQLWATFLEVAGSFHVPSGSSLPWLHLSLGSCSLMSSPCPWGVMPSTVARLWCLMGPAHSTGRGPYSHVSSSASSQLDSLASWGLTDSGPLFPGPRRLGYGFVLEGELGVAYGGGLEREALTPALSAGLAGVFRGLLWRGCVVLLLLASLVVLAGGLLMEEAQSHLLGRHSCYL